MFRHILPVAALCVPAAFRSAASSVFRLRDREMVKAEVSADLACTVNSYFYTWHAVGDSAQWHRTKNVHVWRRDDGGEWRLEVDIWNSDVRLEDFAGE